MKNVVQRAVAATLLQIQNLELDLDSETPTT
jgi:hypothetical protein